MLTDPFRARANGNFKWLSLLLGLVAIFALAFGEVAAQSPPHAQRAPARCSSLVVQGRIIGLSDSVVTVKTPDAYPGGQGIHAQFVTQGASFRVDISRARVLLPDGRQSDRRPLAEGDRVVMLLCGPSTAPHPAEPGSTYSARIIERLVTDEKVFTH